MKQVTKYTALALLVAGATAIAQVGIGSGKTYYGHENERHDFDDIHIKSGGTITYDGTATVTGIQPKQEVTAYSANGAITIKPGIANLTKAGVDAMTLASPAAADNGTVLIITTQTANAHTVTLTAGFNGGGGGADVATFGGAIGDNLVIVAINAVWHVISLHNVTLG